MGDADAVKHPVAVKEVVGPTREELRVRPISYIGSVKTCRKRAFDHFTFRRRKLRRHGGEIVRKDIFWINGLP